MTSIQEIEKQAKHIRYDDQGLKYVGKYPGFYLAKFLASTSVTPNQVSLVNVLWLLVPVSLLSAGGYLFGVLGTLAGFVNLILDCTDGALARAKKKKTLMGRYYEYLFHIPAVPLLMIGLSIFSFRHFQNPSILVLGSVTVMANLVSTISRLCKDSTIVRLAKKHGKVTLTATPEVNIWDQGTSKQRLASRFIFVFNSVGNLHVILFITALSGVLQYAIFFYAPFYTLIAIGKLFLEIKSEFKDFKYN